MSIKISATLKNKLPLNEKDGIEDALWDKSGGKCFLCEVALNRSADAIEADHDTPESQGGSTDLANLNLSHATCNRAKRNARSVEVRPYLKLTAFSSKRRLKYDGYLEHFQIDPKPVVMVREGDMVRFELPDGSATEVPVFEETNTLATFDVAFLELPREAIFNDDACQPRAIRPEHAWAIYADLQRNPLHEPPSVRAETVELGKPVRLLMFDGQHKTIAAWMMGRSAIIAKVYLNLNVAQANELVNSIQAKIRKLPLSPFELAGKMSDEWENKFVEYEEEIGSGEVSEKGFLEWLGPTLKARGRSALKEALVQNVLSADDLRIRKHVKRPGEPVGQVSLTEQQLKGKLVEKLLSMEAQSQQGEAAQAVRDLEAANVVLCLNLFNDLAFDPQDEAQELTAGEAERARRMTYQAALAHIATLIRTLWLQTVIRSGSLGPIDDELTAQQLHALTIGIERLVEHPVWTASFSDRDIMKRVKIALEKNQEAAKVLAEAGLTLAYLVIGKDDAGYKAVWGPE